MPLNPLFQHSIIPTFQGVLKPEKPLKLQLVHRTMFSLTRYTVSHKDSAMWLNKYIFSVLVIAFLMIAACASSRATYVCSDGNRFRVTITHNGEKAVLWLGERPLELPRVRSASGAKYSDGETTFWSKGNQAIIATNDKISHKDCTVEE